jgi:hypothetical protein
MTIYQCMPRCGLGRPGEVAVAPYFIEKIAIFVGGGLVGSHSFCDQAVEFDRSARSPVRKT